MHVLILVITKGTADTNKKVDRALEDFYRCKLDYHQIGNDWTGVLDGFDPTTDPDNKGKSPDEWKRRDSDTMTVGRLRPIAHRCLAVALMSDGEFRDIRGRGTLEDALAGEDDDNLVTAVDIRFERR